MSTNERQCADSQKVGSRIIHFKALASKLEVDDTYNEKETSVTTHKCQYLSLTFVSGHTL